MKKKFLLFILSVIAMYSCGNKCNEKDIDAVNKKYETALSNYIADDSKANCNALKKVLNEYVDIAGDCDEFSAAEINEFKNDIKTLVCE